MISSTEVGAVEAVSSAWATPVIARISRLADVKSDTGRIEPPMRLQGVRPMRIGIASQSQVNSIHSWLGRACRIRHATLRRTPRGVRLLSRRAGVDRSEDRAFRRNDQTLQRRRGRRGFGDRLRGRSGGALELQAAALEEGAGFHGQL